MRYGHQNFFEASTQKPYLANVAPSPYLNPSGHSKASKKRLVPGKSTLFFDDIDIFVLWQEHGAPLLSPTMYYNRLISKNRPRELFEKMRTRALYNKKMEM